MLPQMAAGLNSILFAITIDNEVLNFWSSSTPSLLQNGTTDDDILAPKTVKSIETGASSDEKKKSRNKKKGSSQVSVTSVFDFQGAELIRCTLWTVNDVRRKEKGV